MRETDSLLPALFAILMGLALVAAIFLQSGGVFAAEISSSPRPLKCSPIQADKCILAIKATINHRNSTAEYRSAFDEFDKRAALRSVQFALSNVGDGGSYVWHRVNGRFSGVIQPTESFKDGGGRVCRHVIIKFSAGNYAKKIETVACRRDSGVWEISG